MSGVAKEFPVPKARPPVAAAYQEIVPEDAVAAKLTDPAPVLEPGVVLVILGVTVEFTARVWAVPLPQEMHGVTVMFPEPEPTVTVMALVVVPAVCTQPVGKVQL